MTSQVQRWKGELSPEGACFVRVLMLLGSGLGLVVKVHYKIWGNHKRERKTPDMTLERWKVLES